MAEYGTARPKRRRGRGLLITLIILLIIVAGVPLGIPGTTNMVRIASVGSEGDANM